MGTFIQQHIKQPYLKPTRNIKQTPWYIKNHQMYKIVVQKIDYAYNDSLTSLPHLLEKRKTCSLQLFVVTWPLWLMAT